MSSTQQDIARRVAMRLSTEFGHNLPATLEAQLLGAGAPPQRYEIATIVAVATLILEVAKFGWEVYLDRKKNARPVDADSMGRTIRLQLSATLSLPDAQRDRVIQTVVEEILNSSAST